MRYTRAIARRPGPSMIHGLTTSDLGPPDYQKALIQYDAYVDALRDCGLTVTVLPPDNDHPDSTFVEDTALLTPECAIMMRPGAPSRRGETREIETVVKQFFQTVETVEVPGTAEAGDIMMVGTHYYIGLSDRTNPEGAQQIIEILQNHGMTGSTVPLKHVLHLKSGVAYLENFNLLVAGEFKSHPELARFTRIPIDDNEQYAANCVWINGTVLVPAGFPKTEQAIKSCGYRTIALDVSEFRKLDGGLSCLSLRF
ncbi:MAG: N(G),N(G)-dimethylarginine dimethylaminohydrolase [candidate division Zixibacteria bacterium]|nr:N(G),N(G)-dimethylarginine dimethylaminohydrolase [candidate division Zixibacteria bacterium]